MPARDCFSHARYRCDFDARVPGARRTSLHVDTFVLRTDSSYSSRYRRPRVCRLFAVSVTQTVNPVFAPRSVPLATCLLLAPEACLESQHSHTQPAVLLRAQWSTHCHALSRRLRCSVVERPPKNSLNFVLSPDILRKHLLSRSVCVFNLNATPHTTCLQSLRQHPC